MVQQRIRPQRERQKRLKHELSQAIVPKKLGLRETNQKFEAALTLFARLQQSLVRSDFKTMRECLEKTIDKVLVKFSKTKQVRRHRYQLLGGEIYIRMFLACTALSGVHRCSARYSSTSRQLTADSRFFTDGQITSSRFQYDCR